MGDFSAHFHRPESGIHTVEGNVAGARAAQLTKQRQKQQAEFEEKQLQIRSSKDKSLLSKQDKFQGDSSLSKAEKTFKSKTVGLVTAEEFRRLTEESAQQAQKNEDDVNEESQPKLTAEEQARLEKIERKKRKQKRKEKRKQMSALSFAHDEQEQDLFETEDTPTLASAEKTARSLKDPTVDTSFLPDQQRERQEQQERRRLEQEWKQKQAEIKGQPLEIVYSYWDGSGHRRSVQVKKGDTIAAFLELVRQDLSNEFREMKNVSSDALLYVKEDLILPQDLTFYDLIATKARGKSGPLFHFDVHEDVRIGAIDTRVEKDESHPGKVVERQWYERNKHIFPASRWEIFDPAKEYGSYTIHGGEVNKSNKKQRKG